MSRKSCGSSSVCCPGWAPLRYLWVKQTLQYSMPAHAYRKVTIGRWGKSEWSAPCRYPASYPSQVQSDASCPAPANRKHIRKCRQSNSCSIYFIYLLASSGFVMANTQMLLKVHTVELQKVCQANAAQRHVECTSDTNQ